MSNDREMVKLAMIQKVSNPGFFRQIGNAVRGNKTALVGAGLGLGAVGLGMQTDSGKKSQRSNWDRTIAANRMARGLSDVPVRQPEPKGPGMFSRVGRVFANSNRSLLERAQDERKNGSAFF